MKIALIGYGKMGQMIEKVADKHGIEIVERFMDVRPIRDNDSIRQNLKNVSVLLDFSVPEAVLNNIRVCAALSKNMVLGTTGWHNQLNEAQKIVEHSNIGLVYASNFSLGINLFYKIVERACEIFSSFESYDPYIEESHHKFKKDAPSGTALKLKEILKKQYEEKIIPITSVRAGHIPGVHRVSFDSAVDTVRLEHATRSREGFAEGAILAAKWIAEKNGFYEFREILESIFR